MTLEQGQAWFRTLSRTDKVRTLLSFMHGLTLVGRIVTLEYEQDSQTRANFLYDISQLNHHLTSAALQTLTETCTYSDDFIVEMMYQPGRSEFIPLFRDAFEQTMTFVSSTAKRSLP